MNNRLVVEKARVIKENSDLAWAQCLKAASQVKKINKTQAIIELIKNEGSMEITVMMGLTGWDRHNIQSTFRTSAISRTHVYFDRENQMYRYCA